MSSYPEIIPTDGALGPSPSSLRVAYFEEHGVMPDPDLQGELLKRFWETVPLSQNSAIRPSIQEMDQAQPQRQDVPADTEADGHLKLVQRRLDLAPFLGPSPAEIYGGPLGVPWPGVLTGSGSAPPVVDPQLMPAGPFFDHDPPVNDLHVPAANHQASVAYHGTPLVNVASDVVSQAAPTAEQAFASLLPRASTAVPQARRTYKTKDPWTKSEVQRVMYLRDTKNKNWAEIQEDLGTHTAGSIADKYWQTVRVAKGLKK